MTRRSANLPDFVRASGTRMVTLAVRANPVGGASGDLQGAKLEKEE